jgi:hypothetical protein
MIAVEYYALGEYGTSLQMAGQSLLQIPSEEKSTLESVAPKQVYLSPPLSSCLLLIQILVSVVCSE